MIKRIVTLVLTSSLISAGLLYLGFAFLSQSTPAYASSQKALVAKTDLQSFIASFPFVESKSPTSNSSVVDDSSVDSAKSSDDSSSSSDSSQSASVSSSTTSTTSATVVTIAELLQNPELYDDSLVSISGIATSLSDEKFLLNDGTGQILVELEDEDGSSTSVDGLSISVVGKFDDESNSLSGEVEAFTITYQGQVIYQKDSMDDDSNDGEDSDDDGDDSDDDDMDDDGDDSSDDDLDDDGDDSGDDDMDDESGDDDDDMDDDSSSSDDSHDSGESDD